MSENMLPDGDEKYDIAISYHAPSIIPMFYVIDRIKANQKFLWIHGDVQKLDQQHHFAKNIIKNMIK